MIYLPSRSAKLNENCMTYHYKAMNVFISAFQLELK